MGSRLVEGSGSDNKGTLSPSVHLLLGKNSFLGNSSTRLFYLIDEKGSCAHARPVIDKEEGDCSDQLRQTRAIPWDWTHCHVSVIDIMLC